MKKIKEKINRFFAGRYGMDELGKTLLIVSSILYLLGGILQNGILLWLAIFGICFTFYRMFSRQHWDRREENRKYNRFLKLWKLRFQERKTSRIYVCKGCGRFIRVPKGRGKIQVTCTVCGNKSMHRS